MNCRQDAAPRADREPANSSSGDLAEIHTGTLPTSAPFCRTAWNRDTLPRPPGLRAARRRNRPRATRVTDVAGGRDGRSLSPTT
jgi:hypothetical protein